MPFYELKKKLAEDIARFIGHPEVHVDLVFGEFTVPPGIAIGHLGFPCFHLAKILDKPTDQLAGEIADHFSRAGLMVKAAGPYANFKWDPAFLFEQTLARVLEQEARYGSDDSGAKKRVVLEYCSPNIANRLALHHLRSTLIGNTLANVYAFGGYATERICFIGDWGLFFARLLAAVELWGDKTLMASAAPGPVMDHLAALYVRFHKEVDQNPTLLERAARCLQSLEAGDEGPAALWKRIREISLKSMEGTLARLGARFDHTEGESRYVPSMEATLTLVKEKAEAHLSEGAWIVDIPGLPSPAVIQKRDGTTLYLTRDIAAAMDRAGRFGFNKMLYVVSEQQSLHFQLLFGVLKKMGLDWAERCEHLSFGTVLLGSEKMSSREGRVVYLEDLLNEARGLALAECSAKNPDLADPEGVAENLAIGAVIFGQLNTHRASTIEFDWKQMLALDGDTGPYVQYTLVRCQSLLAKAGPLPSEVTSPSEYVYSSEEEALVLQIAKFRSTLRQVVSDSEPYFLTRYLLDVARAFNRFYNRFPVVQATDAASRAMRVNLVRGTGQVLKNGLTLLGIPCPKEM